MPAYTDRLNKCLENFSDIQRNTIAEMAASDCMILAAWEDSVLRFIKDSKWSADRLKRVIVHRVAEIAEDLVIDIVPE